ncbi:PadR family transcriptional regulator [Bhargavaea beijingensis]|uniref:PadR family transcriptional regulator n=1 Tax=Bhargavaea beijingensis TaxID=426756 RepID=A0ABX9ZEL5_9BACL|nr:PadR family transcriptional regulator [Bhargavaea beijingensis]
MLSKLEKKGYVQHGVIEQQGKPNKKEYYITDNGRSKLKEWIEDEKPSEPIFRDEFIIKIYSSWLSGPETTITLLKERQHFTEELEKLKNDQDADFTDYQKGYSSRYYLLSRRLAIINIELEWTDRLLKSLLAQMTGSANK